MNKLETKYCMPDNINSKEEHDEYIKAIGVNAKILIKDFDTLLQIVCDTENQPHQFIGDSEGLKKAFKVKFCECIEPPELDKDDVIIRLCGKCGDIVSTGTG